MKQTLRRILSLLTVIGLILVVAAGWYLAKAFPIGTGYTAKYLCTSTFVAQRDPEVVFAEDVKPINPLFKPVRWRVDRDRQTVTAAAFTAFQATAVYREGCGCTLLAGITEDDLRRQTFYRDDHVGEAPAPSPDMAWPQGNGEPVDPRAFGVDADLLEKALDRAFAEPGPDSLMLPSPSNRNPSIVM